MKRNAKILLCILLFLQVQTSYGQKFIDLYTYNYDQVDQHVKNLQADYASIDLLAEELFEPFSSPHERVRAAWKWVTKHIAYDVGIYQKKGYQASFLPSEVLQKKSAVCYGYSNLLKALLDISDPGICQIIIGEVRTGFKKTEGHAWNLVTLYGYSYLLDPTWGAGYVEVGKKPETENEYTYLFKSFYQEFWYFTIPTYFATSHFTDFKAAQLMAQPITKEQFMGLPWISPKYYGAHLKSLKQRYDDGIAFDSRNYLTKIIPNEKGQAFKILNPVGKEYGSYRYDYLFDQGWDIKVNKGDEINLHFYSELAVDKFKIKEPADSTKQQMIKEINSIEQKRGRGYDYIIKYKVENEGELGVITGEDELVRYKLSIVSPNGK